MGQQTDRGRLGRPVLDRPAADRAGLKRSGLDRSGVKRSGAVPEGFARDGLEAEVIDHQVFGPGAFATLLVDRPVGAVSTKRSQVRAILERLIEAELSSGDAIPSERVLVQRLGVSRVTIRQAIADLVDAGVLERVHGKGTYVTGPQVDSRLHLTSFSREMRDRGLVPATVVLSAREELADDDVAYALRIRPGRRVIRVERLRTADGTPMAYEVGHYPSRLFPGLLERELGSLYDVFADEYGVVVTSGEQTVRAEAADAQQARILGVTKRAPLLVQERVTYAAERPIELATSWYRADRYRLRMAITPHGTRETG